MKRRMIATCLMVPAAIGLVLLTLSSAGAQEGPKGSAKPDTNDPQIPEGEGMFDVCPNASGCGQCELGPLEQLPDDEEPGQEVKAAGAEGPSNAYAAGGCVGVWDMPPLGPMHNANEELNHEVKVAKLLADTRMAGVLAINRIRDIALDNDKPELGVKTLMKLATTLPDSMLKRNALLAAAAVHADSGNAAEAIKTLEMIFLAYGKGKGKERPNKAFDIYGLNANDLKMLQEVPGHKALMMQKKTSPEMAIARKLIKSINVAIEGDMGADPMGCPMMGGKGGMGKGGACGHMGGPMMGPGMIGKCVGCGPMSCAMMGGKGCPMGGPGMGPMGYRMVLGKQDGRRGGAMAEEVEELHEGLAEIDERLDDLTEMVEGLIDEREAPRREVRRERPRRERPGQEREMERHERGLAEMREALGRRARELDQLAERLKQRTRELNEQAERLEQREARLEEHLRELNRDRDRREGGGHRERERDEAERRERRERDRDERD